MDVLTAILLALHLIGMALIVGTFFVQMRAKERFATGLMLTGAIIQIVTGATMFALLQAEPWFDDAKYGTHGAIGLVVLAAAIVAHVQQSRGGRVAPWFHTAGGLAVVNLLIAVLWRSYS